MPAPDDPPTIAGFRIKRPLGAGGMGAVYLAERLGAPGEIALKVLIETDPRSLDRFRRELESLLAVDRHPGVVRVLAAGLDHRPPWLALEYVAGETLEQRLARGAPLPLEETLELGSQIVTALAFLHAKSILHRDLKPSNILLRPSTSELERVALTDFGIARIESASSLTRTGELVGSVPWMAPECFSDSPIPGPALDRWSLGVILYECLTGERPFQAGSTLALVTRICSENPTPPKARRPDVPLALNALVLRLLDKNPKRRYPDTATLLEDLEALRDGRPTSEILHPKRQRRAIPTLGMGLALLLGLGGAAAATIYRRREVRRQQFSRELSTVLPALRRQQPEHLESMRRRAARRLLAAAMVQVPVSVEVPGLPRSEALARARTLIREGSADPALRSLASRLRDHDAILQAERARALLRALAKPTPSANGEEPDSRDPPGASEAAFLTDADRALLAGLDALPGDLAGSRRAFLRAHSDPWHTGLATLGRALAQLTEQRWEDAAAELNSGPVHDGLAPAFSAARQELRERRLTHRLIHGQDRIDDATMSEVFTDRRPEAIAGRVNRHIAEAFERLSGADPKSLAALARAQRRIYLAMQSEPRLRPPETELTLLRKLVSQDLEDQSLWSALITALRIARRAPETEPQLPIGLHHTAANLRMEVKVDPATIERERMKVATVAARLGFAVPMIRDEQDLAHVPVDELVRDLAQRPDDPMRAYWLSLRKAYLRLTSRGKRSPELLEAERREICRQLASGRLMGPFAAELIRIEADLITDPLKALTRLESARDLPLFRRDVTLIEIVRSRLAAGRVEGLAETIAEARAAAQARSRATREGRLQLAGAPGCWQAASILSEDKRLLALCQVLSIELAVLERRYEDAITLAEELKGTGFDRPECSYHMGIAALRLGRRRLARRCLEDIRKAGLKRYRRFERELKAAIEAEASAETGSPDAGPSPGKPPR